MHSLSAASRRAVAGLVLVGTLLLFQWIGSYREWPDLSAAVAWGAKGTVATLHNGTALQALW